MLIIKEKNEDREKLWNLLNEYTREDFPMCCNTSEDIDKSANLSPGHSYTLLATALLEDTEGVHHKLVKLRDPWGKGAWEGTANEKDRVFWSKIVNSTEKKEFEKKMQAGSKGVFYMTYIDFCQHFSQVHYCLLHKNANYISETLFCNKKNGRLFEL